MTIPGRGNPVIARNDNGDGAVRCRTFAPRYPCASRGACPVPFDPKTCGRKTHARAGAERGRNPLGGWMAHDRPSLLLRGRVPLSRWRRLRSQNGQRETCTRFRAARSFGPRVKCIALKCRTFDGSANTAVDHSRARSYDGSTRPPRTPSPVRNRADLLRSVSASRGFGTSWVHANSHLPLRRWAVDRRRQSARRITLRSFRTDSSTYAWSVPRTSSFTNVPSLIDYGRRGEHALLHKRPLIWPQSIYI